MPDQIYRKEKSDDSAIQTNNYTESQTQSLPHLFDKQFVIKPVIIQYSLLVVSCVLILHLRIWKLQNNYNYFKFKVSISSLGLMSLNTGPNVMRK